MWLARLRRQFFSGVGVLEEAKPLKNCLRSLANHTVFGLGLYASAVLVALVAR